MSKIELPYFGIIDGDPLEEYYEAEITVNGSPIDMDLNLDENTISEDDAKIIADYTQKLDEYYKSIWETIKGYSTEEGIVKEYIEYYTDGGFEPEDIEALIKDANPNLSLEEKLLSALKLERIGLYPKDSRFAVWDFMIGQDISDQILVIITDEKGKVVDITWES